MFGSKRNFKSINDFTVRYRDNTIVSSDSVKYLGINLDSNLSGEQMAMNISAKAIGKLNFLYRYSNILSVLLRKKKATLSFNVNSIIVALRLNFSSC